MVVVGGWSNVPPLKNMRFPCSALLRLLVDEDVRAWRGKRCAVEIEGAIELGVSGQSRIYARWAKDIEGCYRLDGDTSPEMKGGILVGDGEASNEVFLGCFDGLFSGILVVAVGWY